MALMMSPPTAAAAWLNITRPSNHSRQDLSDQLQCYKLNTAREPEAADRGLDTKQV
jgi:hypothetical protein